jgi:hypothetical protein
MATPAGYIDASDGGWEITTSGTYTIVAYIPLPLEPPHWGAETNERYEINMQRQYTVPATATLTERVSSAGYGGVDQDVSGTVSGSWGSYDADYNFPRESDGYDYGIGNYPSSYPKPKFDKIKITATADTANCELMGLYFNLDTADDIDDPEPEQTEYYERFGTNTAVWTPYLSNSCTSAWEAKQLIAKNLNRVAFESKPVWSVPL